MSGSTSGSRLSRPLPTVQELVKEVRSSHAFRDVLDDVREAWPTHVSFLQALGP